MHGIVWLKIGDWWLFFGEFGCELVDGSFEFAPLVEVSDAEFVFAFPLPVAFLPQVHAYLASAVGFKDDYGFPPEVRFVYGYVVDDFVDFAYG